MRSDNELQWSLFTSSFQHVLCHFFFLLLFAEVGDNGRKTTGPPCVICHRAVPLQLSASGSSIHLQEVQGVMLKSVTGEEHYLICTSWSVATG